MDHATRLCTSLQRSFLTRSGLPAVLQALFRRAQLKALVDLHSTTEGMGGYLGEEEINIIRGALDLTGKQAMVAMTPLDKVSALPSLALELVPDIVLCTIPPAALS